MDYDICIGCAYCAVACPYQARTIAHEIHGYYDGEITRQEEAVFDDGRIGVAQKCTFCIDRVDSGLEAGLTPGLDPDATPACSAACIASAITFGDYNDPDSTVSQLVRDNPAFQMHEELGTDPQIKYLYTTPAVPGREPEAADHVRRAVGRSGESAGRHTSAVLGLARRDELDVWRRRQRFRVRRLAGLLRRTGRGHRRMRPVAVGGAIHRRGPDGVRPVLRFPEDRPEDCVSGARCRAHRRPG